MIWIKIGLFGIGTVLACYGTVSAHREWIRLSIIWTGIALCFIGILA